MRVSCQSFDIALPTVRPLIEWRVEDERRAGCPLWVGEIGEGETVSKEYVAGDAVAGAHAALVAIGNLKDGLKAERAEADKRIAEEHKRIAEIDSLLKALGDVAKPKRGRPVGSRAKKGGAEQPIET